MPGMRRALARVLAGAAAAWLLVCAASAQEKLHFSIPAQEASTAIQAWALQSGLQVFAADEHLQGVRTNEVNGEYTALEAIRLLFEGTGLEIVPTGDRTVIVRRPSGSQPSTSALSPDERLSRFFEEVFQRDLERSPMRQSRLGMRANQDQWDEIGERRQIEDVTLALQDLTRLRNFDYASLGPQSQLSYRLFEYETQRRIESFQWRRHRYRLTQMGGLHRAVAITLQNDHPIGSVKDAEDYVARLIGVEPLMEQLVEELRLQEAAGVKPPRFVYPLVIGECESLIRGRPIDESGEDSPLYRDFKSKLARTNLPTGEKSRLLAQAEAALRGPFAAGYRRLIAHLREAASTATDDAGVWKLPNGDAYYRWLLESYTTLPVTAEQLHERGLQEVARIHGEMREVMAKVGFRGSLQEFFAHLRNAPEMRYPDTPEGRERYLQDAERLIAEIRGRMDELFSLQPRAGVVVRPVEPWREKSAAKAFYQSPPQDGSRPAIFYINLYDMAAQPKYELAAVTYHETIPGHHVETVVAYELPDLPKFRKYASYAAFSEGWGLYAERLPKELGLYRDPYQDFGRLAFELMRAVRLVVDTGLHAKRWTREQAVEYMNRNMPSTPYDNQREVDRYIVMPGQATSYAVGLMKILELRSHAQRSLGERFDLRAFHDAVLGQGPMPLTMLQESIEAWIAAQS